MFKDINPTEAHRLLTGGEVATYIDVRTVQEYEAGHPDGAFNVPVAEPDPATGQMAFNESFLDVVQANFKPDEPIIVGCKMGGRSAKAAQILVAARFEKVSNMRGGFDGARDPLGQVVEPGWQACGYPVQTGSIDGRSYASLRGAET